MLPYSYWALTCLAVLPTYSAFMISVRQASDLPPASFRFPVTQDTLALGYILPAVGRIGDFHPLKHAPAGRTKNATKTGSHSYFCRILNSLFINRRIFHFSALPNVFPNTDPAFIIYCASPHRRFTALKIPLKDALVMLELMPTPYVTLPVF